MLFANSFPVWIQGLPRLWVSDEAAFNGAVIEIVSERKAGDLRRLLRVGVDGDVHVRRDGDRPYLDLMGAKELKSVYGTLHLSCRLPAYPDQRPLNCSLVRCPNVDLDYVLDPVMPQLAQAVRVRCHDRVECGADSEVVLGERGERIFRAQRPVDCPGVTCILPDSHVELRIRVPVTRVYPIGRQIRTDKWCCPPIQLDLRAVELNDRLRVELHEEPELENGQLLCRLVGGGEVNAGIPTRTAHTYEINLHRWRDTLGFGVGGTVQVRGRTRWLEIAQLPAPPAVYERQSPPPISGRARLIQALEMAAQTGDLASVADLVTDCAAAIERGHVVDAELLPVALGRAYMAWGEYDKCESCLAGLCSREDLHEVRIVLAAVALRRGRDRNAVDLSNKRALLADTLIECPQKHLLFAEHYYHMATLLGGKSVGSWQTCEQEAGNARKMLGTGSPPWSVDYLDACLLQMLARLMLAQEPAPPLPDVPNRWRWLDVLSFVADHVRTAWVKKARKRKPPALPRSSPTILRRNELDLIRLGYFQAVGAATESASLLARFNGWTRDDFFAIRLLRARQARLEGRDEDARREYRHLVDEASSNGPDFLLDVAAEEQI